MNKNSQHPSWGKVAVGCRIGKHPENQFFVSWTQLLFRGLRRGDAVLTPASQLPAHWAGDVLARGFLKTDCNALLLVDDDMAFEATALEELRSNESNWGFDMVSAFYTTRSFPPRPLVFRLFGGDRPEHIAQGEMYQHISPVPDNTVMEIPLTGWGFTLIRRRVIEAMVDPELGPQRSYYFAYGPGWESDDIPFCRRARELGFRLAVDSSVKVDHIGAIPIGWEQYQGWLRLEAAKKNG